MNLTSILRHSLSLQGKFASLGNMIGNTPMLEIHYAFRGQDRMLYVKCEFRNLTGSIKDRMALHIIRKAYDSGELDRNTTIIEVTSGNTGISFASLGRMFGHPVKIIMPDWLSRERKLIIRNFGAEIIEVSREQGGFIQSMKVAEQIRSEVKNAFLPKQFANPDNAEVHRLTTGHEIWEQLRMVNKIPDAFVAGVGSGGTIMGVGAFLKDKRINTTVHPLEPAESPTLSTGYKIGSHRIQGISDEFIPELVRLDQLDATLQAHDGDAILMAQKIACELGIGVGISSGANILGAIQLQNELGANATVATILPDSDKKYFSTDLMREEQFQPYYLTPEVEFKGYKVIPHLQQR